MNNNELLNLDLRQYVVDVRSSHVTGQQMILKFPNNFGASIVRHHLSIGNENGLFELAVIKWEGGDWDLCYTTPITSDVLGHLTPQEVVDTLNEILILPEE